MNMYKIFIVAGIVLIIVGIIGYIFGQLPGDFKFKKGNTTVYFPLMTSIIVSIILSAIFYFVSQSR